MRPAEVLTPDQALATQRFLLDTNVISHVIRPKKQVDGRLNHFFDVVDEQRLYVSTITIGEIEKGIGLIPWPSNSEGRDERARLQAVLEQRLEQLCDRFDGRIISVDTRVARQWGRLHAERERAGRKTPAVDTMIAACALTNYLIVATADADFAAFDQAITVYNPLTHSLSGYRPWSGIAEGRP